MTDATTGKRWAVECAEFVTWHRSEEAAQRALEATEKAGACKLPHRVVPPR